MSWACPADKIVELLTAFCHMLEHISFHDVTDVLKIELALFMYARVSSRYKTVVYLQKSHSHPSWRLKTSCMSASESQSPCGILPVFGH